MAAASGKEGAVVTAEQSGDALLESLLREPWSFDFFQAVRLFELRSNGREPVGGFANPRHEAVRLGAHTGMAFPASESQSAQARDGQRPVLRVNFMGLTGPLGVLPLAYTALLEERRRAHDHAACEFLDIFHHRLLSLFYRAWEKYRFGVPYERGERDPVSRHLADLIGIGAPELEDRLAVPDEALVFYAGLLAMGTRPAVALEQILGDYFGVPVEVVQFAGCWRAVDPEDQCFPGVRDGAATQLNAGALLGSRIWNQQSKIRIRLGPLSLARYQEFLPGGNANRELRDLVAFYAGLEFDFEAELVLRREEAPGCDLESRPDGRQLGWTTWLKTRPLGCDPGDAVLEL